MTPNDVEILLHCHSCPVPHPRADAPAVAEALKKFEMLGAIVNGVGHLEGVYNTTDLGKAWVSAICNVPLPRIVFLGTDGEPINE